MTLSPQQRAGELLRRHAVTRAPVPVEDIARAEGASLGFKRHDGPEYGFVYRDPKARPVIGVNSATSAVRQREAVAHCLGHLLMHAGALIVCHGARLGTRGLPAAASDAQEAEANAFAMALLMPAALVIAAVDDFAAGRPQGESPVPRDELAAAMARAFGTGGEAATCRLVTLGLLAV